jgi:predicted aldo/keto reductase-like oxidoreductase
MDVSRRNFLKHSTIGLVGAGVVGQAGFLKAEEKKTPKPLKVKAYRTLGHTGFKASDIGSGGPSDVAVLNTLLDAGVNYIDTAESYSRGQSEIITGQAIKNRDRNSLFITSKLHLEENESKESVLNRARKCLERLDTEYLDCMMMHNAPTAESVKYEPFHEVMKQLKREGKLRFTGISCHGPRRPGSKADSMEKVLTAGAMDGRFDVMLLIHNFIQKEPGERLIALCKEKNIGTTFMKTNPVGRYLSLKARAEAQQKAGKEVSSRMRDYLERMKEAAEKGEMFVKKYGLENPAEIRAASTRFILSNKDAGPVLARCSSFEDVEQFLSVSGTTLSDMETKKLAAFTRGPGRLYCRHACGICEPNCPYGVPVNTIMRYNHYFDAQGLEKYALEKYAALPTAKADRCQNCAGQCETACPYNVPVQGLLNLAHETLSLV